MSKCYHVIWNQRSFFPPAHFPFVR